MPNFALAQAIYVFSSLLLPYGDLAFLFSINLCSLARVIDFNAIVHLNSSVSIEFLT